MSNTVDVAFQTLWLGEVHQAFQQTTSLLRNSVRVRNGVVGTTVKFPKLGTFTTVDNKPRHQDLAPANVTHTDATCTLYPTHGAEYIDNIDQFQTDIDLRREYTMGVSAAMNRSIDARIITAATATTNTVSGSALDAAGVIAMAKALNEANVPVGDRYLVISPGGLADMQADAKLASRDFVSNALLKDGVAKDVMGFTVIMSNYLTASTTNRYCLAFHKSALGLGIGGDIDVALDYLPQKRSWQVSGELFAGSVLIDVTGVHKMLVAD